MRFSYFYLLLPIACLAGCAAAAKYERGTDYFASYSEPVQGAKRASLIHNEGIAALELGDLAKAERLLKQSLGMDSRFGPAHNTLGTVFFQQGNFYPAAWEFEYAQRLMPSRPEPANNLGLVYEKVQRFDEALTFFEKAIEIEPSNAEYLGNWIRLKMKQGCGSDEIRPALQRLLEIEFRPDWAEWARRNLAMGEVKPRAFSVEQCLPAGDTMMEYATESLDGSPGFASEAIELDPPAQLPTPLPPRNGEVSPKMLDAIPDDSFRKRDFPNQ